MKHIRVEGSEFRTEASADRARARLGSPLSAPGRNWWALLLALGVLSAPESAGAEIPLSAAKDSPQLSADAFGVHGGDRAGPFALAGRSQTPAEAIVLASNERHSGNATSGKRDQDDKTSKNDRSGGRDKKDKKDTKDNQSDKRGRQAGERDKHDRADRKDGDHDRRDRDHDRDRRSGHDRDHDRDHRSAHDRDRDRDRRRSPPDPAPPTVSPGPSQPSPSQPGPSQPGPSQQTTNQQPGSDFSEDSRTDLRISPLSRVTVVDLVRDWFTSEPPEPEPGPVATGPSPGIGPVPPAAVPAVPVGPSPVALTSPPGAGPTEDPDPSAGPVPTALVRLSPFESAASPRSGAGPGAPDPAYGLDPVSSELPDFALQRAGVVDALANDLSGFGRSAAQTAAVQALGAFSGSMSIAGTVDAAGAELSVSLVDPDPRVRRRAAVAIGRVNMAVAQAIPLLFNALCSQDVPVQKRAAIILAGVDDYATNVVPALAERITSDDEPPVARAATQALGNLGVYAIGGLPTLVGALDHDDLGVRYYAGDSVGSVDDQMTAASGAIRTIGLRCGDPSGAAVQQLAAKLQPDRADFREKATQSLAAIGQSAQSGVPELTARLAQGPSQDRERVIAALTDSARFSSAAVASLAKDGRAPGDGWEVAVGAGPLTTAVGDEQGEVRQAATEGIGVASKEVANASLALQQAPKYDPAVRRATNRALQAIDQYESAAVPALLDALKGDDVEVQRAAAQAIGELGSQAGVTAPALVDAIKSEPVEVRAEAALALGRIHGDPATSVPTLVEALDSPEPAVRYQAARALGLLGGDASPAVPRLQAALKEPDAAMRYQVARALAAIDPATANGRVDQIDKADEQEVAQLLDAVKSGDPTRRRQAGQVLGNLGPEAVATLPSLAMALASAAPETRQQLAMTMQEITSSALAEVPALIRELQQGGAGADRAARTLGELGANANRAKQGLIEGLDDPDPDVRLTLAEALGDLSDYTSQVIGALMIQALKKDEVALSALQQQASGG